MMSELFDIENRVICSNGYGEVSVPECLDCALAGRNHCGMDYGLLKKIHEGSDRSGVHVTDLTGCLLRAYWGKARPKPKYVHEMLVLAMGTAIHGFLEDSDEHMDCELPLEAMGVVGTADVVYKDGRIVDYKSTRWIYPDKLPYGSHTLQVNIYAHLLRRMGRQVKSLAIQYIDVSGPTKCRACKLACPKCGNQPRGAHLGAVLVPVPMMSEWEIEKFIEDRRNILEMALEAGMPPEAEPSFLCDYCEYQEECPAYEG
jgi:CRISPR/Cas system-associated exonuclease Cas4 (RecB family)